MNTRFDTPNEDVTVYAPKCSGCGEQGPDFEVGELAERWLVGHVSIYHPQALDRLTRALAMPKKPKTEPAT